MKLFPKPPDERELFSLPSLPSRAVPSGLSQPRDGSVPFPGSFSHSCSPRTWPVPAQSRSLPSAPEQPLEQESPRQEGELRAPGVSRALLSLLFCPCSSSSGREAGVCAGSSQVSSGERLDRVFSSSLTFPCECGEAGEWQLCECLAGVGLLGLVGASGMGRWNCSLSFQPGARTYLDCISCV